MLSHSPYLGSAASPPQYVFVVLESWNAFCLRVAFPVLTTSLSHQKDADSSSPRGVFSWTRVALCGPQMLASNESCQPAGYSCIFRPGSHCAGPGFCPDADRPSHPVSSLQWETALTVWPILAAPPRQGLLEVYSTNDITKRPTRPCWGDGGIRQMILRTGADSGA